MILALANSGRAISVALMRCEYAERKSTGSASRRARRVFRRVDLRFFIVVHEKVRFGLKWTFGCTYFLSRQMPYIASITYHIATNRNNTTIHATIPSERVSSQFEATNSMALRKSQYCLKYRLNFKEITGIQHI